jgi:paraquat-inducible protein B
VTESEFLERMDRHLAETKAHMARGNELMAQIREEHRLSREEHRLNREEHRRNQARFQSGQQVMRQMVVELREGRAILRDIQDGIRANTEGLLRVLDELRREDGPSAAGA